MPGETGTHGALLHQFIGQHMMKISDSIDLGCGDILPAKAERAHAALHGADHILDLLLHALGTDVPIAHRALRIVARALPSLAAAGDHETRRRIGARSRKRESVE